MSSDRRTARLFAGGGIVADSDPLSELAETQAKFQAMLAAIIRP
jgi:isochorismate synthase EntC